MAGRRNGGLEVDVSLALALPSFRRITRRVQAAEALPAEDCLALSDPIPLGDWLALAAAAGVAAVPALRLGDIATIDLAALAGESEDSVSPDGHAAVEQLAASLQDAPAASLLRWDIGCLEITRAAIRAGRRPAGPERGYSVIRGRIGPCFRDEGLARRAPLWPQPRVTAWLRPWIEPRKIPGSERPCPEVWRIRLGADGGMAASPAHPEAMLPPEDLSGRDAALAAALQLFGRVRAAGIPRPLRTSGPVPCGLDFLIDEAGRALLLDGGPAPAHDQARHGAFLPVPRPDHGAAA